MRKVLVFFFVLRPHDRTLCHGVGLVADLLTGITATMATLGNVGPGLGQVGPMTNVGHLHPVSKCVLIAAMLVGRLEVLTVLARLRPEVWRSTR